MQVDVATVTPVIDMSVGPIPTGEEERSTLMSLSTGDTRLNEYISPVPYIPGPYQEGDPPPGTVHSCP